MDCSVDIGVGWGTLRPWAAPWPYCRRPCISSWGGYNYFSRQWESTEGIRLETCSKSAFRRINLAVFSKMGWSMKEVKVGHQFGTYCGQYRWQVDHARLWLTYLWFSLSVSWFSKLDHNEYLETLNLGAFYFLLLCSWKIKIFLWGVLKQIFSCFDSCGLKLFWNSRIILLKKPQHEIIL